MDYHSMLAFCNNSDRNSKPSISGIIRSRRIRAGEEGEAEDMAASCAACHGTHGRAEGAGLHLAGRPVKELYDALIAYKTGTKAATVMHQHAKGYTDEELRALADHFSKVK